MFLDLEEFWICNLLRSPEPITRVVGEDTLLDVLSNQRHLVEAVKIDDGIKMSPKLNKIDKSEELLGLFPPWFTKVLKHNLPITKARSLRKGVSQVFGKYVIHLTCY